MVITTDIDSIVPSSHSLRTITHTTLITITPTHKIEMTAWTTLPVEMSKTMKAKKMANPIPCRAELTNAFSVGIRAHIRPVSYKTV